MKNIIVLLQEKLYQGTAEEFHKNRLQEIRKRVASLPEGRQLLQMADSLGMDIKMEKMGSMGLYSSSKKRITLNPDFSTKDLTLTLFHELRHMWQFSKHPDEDLPLGTAIAFTRFIEGDAHAFTKGMEKKLQGKEMAPHAWKKHFWNFQKGIRGTSYGFRVISYNRDSVDSFANDDMVEKVAAFRPLMWEFNKKSLKDAIDVDAVAKAGLEENSPSYLSQEERADIHRRILSCTSGIEKIGAVVFQKKFEDLFEKKEASEPQPPRSFGSKLKSAFRITQMGAEVFHSTIEEIRQKVQGTNTPTQKVSAHSRMR